MFKRLLLAGTLLLGSMLAWGQGGSYTGTVTYPSGQYVAAPSILVCIASANAIPCTNKATLYTDSTLATTQANPIILTASSYGQYTFGAAYGCYSLQITAVGFNSTTNNVCFGGAGDQKYANASAQNTSATFWTTLYSTSYTVRGGSPATQDVLVLVTTIASAATQNCFLGLAIDAPTASISTLLLSGTSDSPVTMLWVFPAVTPGAHTFIVSGMCVSGGTVTVNANLTGMTMFMFPL